MPSGNDIQYFFHMMTLEPNYLSTFSNIMIEAMKRSFGKILCLTPEKIPKSWKNRTTFLNALKKWTSEHSWQHYIKPYDIYHIRNLEFTVVVSDNFDTIRNTPKALRIFCDYQSQLYWFIFSHFFTRSINVETKKWWESFFNPISTTVDLYFLYFDPKETIPQPVANDIVVELDTFYKNDKIDIFLLYMKKRMNSKIFYNGKSLLLWTHNDVKQVIEIIDLVTYLKKPGFNVPWKAFLEGYVQFILFLVNEEDVEDAMINGLFFCDFNMDKNGRDSTIYIDNSIDYLDLWLNELNKKERNIFESFIKLDDRGAMYTMMYVPEVVPSCDPNKDECYVFDLF